MAIRFTLNGKPQSAVATHRMPLLWYLRDVLGMTGTKFGCGLALCGACTVHINGQATRSCAPKPSPALDRWCAFRTASPLWPTTRGRRFRPRVLLDIKWDEGANAGQNSAAISKLFANKTLQPGVVCKKVGDVEAGLAGAAQRFYAVYEVPFLAHAPMEPLNTTADVRPDACHIWASTQHQTLALAGVHITGLKPEQIHVPVILTRRSSIRRELQL